MSRVLLALILLCQINATKGQSDYQPTDMAVTVPRLYDWKANQKYEKVKSYSLYLTMRDSTKIAVNVYLPKELKEGEKIPTILHQTRYWRAPDVRWPFNMFTDGLLGNTGKLIKNVILCGYAFVNIDARGSGASFGSRIHPWTMDEVNDGVEIVDWIIEQEWSDGVVGTAGASYSGTTAEFLLSKKHPNVKAAVLMYNLFDVYDDNAFPGGVHNVWFTKGWGEANDQLDDNKLPTKKLKIKMLVKGVAPVKTKGGRKLLKQAIREHQANLNVHDGAVGITFRDDSPTTNNINTMDIFSPHTYVEDVDASGAAVYSYSGWYDGAYMHAAIKRHLNLTNPDNKLILGPWEHGGSMNCSPANPGPAAFDHSSEILKFLDHHLKGMETGIKQEPAVHYFTMVEEKWKAATHWPPPSAPVHYYFSEKNHLNREVPAKEGHIQFKVDTSAGLTDSSRWEPLRGKLYQPRTYPNREIKDKKLLVYDSAPLSEDMEVTGHPVVALYASTTSDDGSFMVYLEDIAEDGSISFVTEGLLRAIHRKPCDEPIHKDVVPCHTYKKEDALPVIPGEVMELKFDLLPTSYLFQKGHRIRIAVSGADKDHFKILTPEEPVVRVYHGPQYPSGIQLPVAD